jgi:hypothetical protein
MTGSGSVIPVGDGHECPRHAPAVVLGLVFAFSSSGLIQKYGGIPGLVGFAIGAVLLMTAAGFFLGRRHDSIDRLFPSLAAAALVILLLLLLFLHPIEDGRGAGKSSDRDEGLELAVGRLLRGENPYYGPTAEAGPLSLLPGAILLAVPFVRLGHVGLQNIFWLVVFVVVAAQFLRSRAKALSLAVLSLALSPSAVFELVSAGDMIANGAYVACFLGAAAWVWTRDEHGLAPKLLTAALLGIGLASRANFILLLPLFAACVWRSSGFGKALFASLLAGGVWMATVLPFYLWDPSAFTPLLSRGKLAVTESVLPWADEAILTSSAVLAAGLALRGVLVGKAFAHPHLFRAAALVTLAPMIGVVIAASLAKGAPDFSPMHDRFGLMAVFLAILGWGGCFPPASDARSTQACP